LTRAIQRNAPSKSIDPECAIRQKNKEGEKRKEKREKRKFSQPGVQR
jgi:hypothetical protein